MHFQLFDHTFHKTTMKASFRLNNISGRFRCFFLILFLTLNIRATAATNSIPLPAAKAIARLQSIHSAMLQYAMVEHSLMSSLIKRDTFMLSVWGLQSPDKLRLVIEGDGSTTFFHDSIYASFGSEKKAVWYDTLSQKNILNKIWYKTYSPLFNAGATLENLFRSGPTPRSFDTTIGLRHIHGYAFTSPLDDPSDSMIGPVTRTYLVDDDSNLIAYSSANMAFHRWISNGAELLSAKYNSVSALILDSAIDSIESDLSNEHYKTIVHASSGSFTAALPKPGTVIRLEGKTTDGNSLSLDAIQSKLILLDFWYSGCGPCRYAIPFLRSMQAKYRSAGLTIVGVDPCDDEPQIVEGVIRSEALKNPEMMIDRSVADSLGVTLYPTFIFLDKNHRVLSYTAGYLKNNEQELEGLIESNLEKAP